MDGTTVTARQGARLEELDREVRTLRERVSLLERSAPQAWSPPRPEELDRVPEAVVSADDRARGQEAVQRADDRAAEAEAVYEAADRARGPEAVHRAADRAGGGESDRAPRAERGVYGTRTDRTRPQTRKGDALEDWLGNRVLGLAGGAAVLLGIAFLVATAVDRGWLGETARVVLGFAGSGLLVLAGCWLHERRGRTQAARAAAASGIAGAFTSLIAATRLYDLVPLPVGLGVGLAVGATAVALAVRWDSRTVGSLGIVGALVAPVLVGADSTGPTVALMLLTLAAGTAVVVWRRWPGLALAAFGVALPQVAAWVTTEPAAIALVAGLTITWALGTAAALGIAARSGDEIPGRAMILLAGSAVFAVAAGNLGLRALGHDTAASIWTVAVALGQVAAGAAALRWTPLQRDLATLSFGASVAAADLALVLLADGATVTIGYVAGGVALAALAASRARRGDERDAAHASLALGAELTLAVVHVLAIDAPPTALIGGVEAIVPATLALAGIAFGAERAARIAPMGAGELRLALRVTAAIALLYLGSVAIVTAFQPETAGIATDIGLLSVRQQGQLLLSGFWGAGGVAALVLGLRRRDAHLRLGGFALLGVASAKVFLFDLSALESLYRVGSFVGLGLLLLCGAFAYQRLRGEGGEALG